MPFLSPLELTSRVYGQLRGYNRWRICAEVDKAAGLSREELSRRQLKLFQQRVLDALRRFPAYAAKVKSACGRVPDSPGEISPETLPVWTKADQRALFPTLAGPPLPGAFVHATGGSTGVPTQFYVTRESYEWRLAVTQRGYGWAHADRGRRNFFIWGDTARQPSRLKALKMAIHERIERRVYFNCFHFSEERKALCCEEINRCRPTAIVAFAGKLAELAAHVRDHSGKLAWKSDFAVTAAEGLQPGQRELIQAHLAREVFLSYGSREFMLMGMECSQHRGYHTSDDNLLVEVVDESGKSSPPGESGRILVTDLHNAANPFIRYETGDRGAMDAPGELCACGLPFRRLLRVDGREQESILTPDGAKLTALFFAHVLKEFSWIDSYQLRQKACDHLCVCLTTSAVLDDARKAEVQAILRPKLGENYRIEVVKVDRLEQLPNGKTPRVISEIGRTIPVG